MAWSGKMIGGLIGGMVGGPVGAGVGATLGHVLADTSKRLEIAQIEWRHHAFSPAGPGVWLTPVWTARGLREQDVRVRLDFGDELLDQTVVVEADVETCHLPRFFVSYAAARDATEATVRVSSGPHRDRANFTISMPTIVRRLGGSGPARVVMALVACARAGGRHLTHGDLAWIRKTFSDGHPLDDEGAAWLEDWLVELAAADFSRLVAERVAARLDPHLDVDARGRLLRWLMRGTCDAWEGDAAEDYIAALGAALQVEHLEELWAEIDAENAADDGRTEAWALLGVPAGTNGPTLRAAWLTLVHRFHPDRGRDADEIAMFNRRLAEINAAYRLLSS